MSKAALLKREDRLGFRRERRDLLRGIAAGSIVGMPLLYTMEMWWRGMTTSEPTLLMLLAAILTINWIFAYFSGFREIYSLFEALDESVTAVAIGLVYSFFVLLLIGAISFDSAWIDTIGKILLATAPVSLGISFANAQLRNRTRTGEDITTKKSDEEDQPIFSATDRQLRQDLIDVGATISGAMLFAYNVAPTEEVFLIASRIPAWQHLLLMAASMGLCYTILFAAEFQQDELHVPSLFQHPWVETTICYALSLCVSFGLLYLVGMPEALSQPATYAKCGVALAFPAVIGASAGRLIT